MRLTLLADAVLALGMMLVYVSVARIVAKRPSTSSASQRALRSFTAWWLGLALVTGAGGARNALAAVGIVERDAHIAVTLLSLPLLVGALGGLLSYLVYLHTGNPRWHAWIVGGHVLLGVFFLGLVVWMSPQAVVVHDWSAPFVYEREPPSAVLVVAMMLILVPVLLASMAYFLLIFRTDDRMARYRIATVSGAFLFWFGTAGLAALVQANEWYWWPLVSRGIALVATLCVLAAYRPPRKIRERLALDDRAEARLTVSGDGNWRAAWTRVRASQS